MSRTPEQLEGQTDEGEQTDGDDHRNDTLRQVRERDERQQELRRIDVALLVLEYRVVQPRVRRVAVQDVGGGRQVREADVPGQEALRSAQRDDRHHDRKGEGHEDERQRARSTGTAIGLGPHHRSFGGRAHLLDDGLGPGGRDSSAGLVPN